LWPQSLRLTPRAAGSSDGKKSLFEQFLRGPSFETPAYGVLLRMRELFAAKLGTLMVRRREAPSRTMRPGTNAAK
jgi:hypothetical protein